MNKSKIRDFLLGTVLFGGMIAGGVGVHNNSKNKEKTKEKPKTETVSENNNVQVADTVKYDANDPYGNIALFEASRSKIKFALAFVENYAPAAYNDGTGKWTVGYGLTILYNADGSSRPVKKGEKCSVDQADVYKGRYLTHDILPDIKKYIKVPMDENTLIATCVFRYCIGGKNFRKSQYLKQLNAGATGADLAKYLTGYRAQAGLMNRNYFFAALMSGQIDFVDLLDLRAEGCYNLAPKDMAKRNDKNTRYIVDKDNMAIWDFSDMATKLETAKKNRKTAKLGECKLVREIVPNYIVQDVDVKPKTGIAGRVKNIARSVDLNQAADKLYELGMKKYENKDYKGALDVLNDLTKTPYNSAKVQNQISVIHHAAGQYKSALRSAEQALQMAKNKTDKAAALYNIGMAYSARGYYKKAIDCYTKAMDLHTNDNRVEQALVDAMIRQEQEGDKSGKTATLFALGAAAVALGTKKRRESHRETIRESR